jgi:hypothetical protein
MGSVRSTNHGWITRTQQQPVDTTPEGSLCGKCFPKVVAPVVAAVAAAPQTATEKEIERLTKAIETARFYARRENRRKTAETIAFLEAKIARLVETI